MRPRLGKGGREGNAALSAEQSLATRRGAMNRDRQARAAAAVATLMAAALFHFFGNATRGYIDTPSLFVWWARQWFDPASEAEHGPIVLMAAALLGMWNLRRTPGATPPAPGLAAGLWLAALGLHLLGYAAQQTRLSAAAWLVFLGGACALAGGRRGVRAAAFPFLFCVFAFPWRFLDEAGVSLRLAVTESTAILANLAGWSLEARGTQLFSGRSGAGYDVTAACSGVRSLVALTAVGTVAAYVALRRWPARLLAIASCFPAAFLANVVRLFLIVAAGETRGPEAAATVHAAGGWLTYVLALAGLAAAIIALRRWDRPHPSEAMSSTPSPLPAPAARSSRRAVWMAGLGFLAAATATAALTRALDRRALDPRAGVILDAGGRAPAELPTLLGGRWAGRPIEVSAFEREALPASTGFSRRLYSTGEHRSEVFLSIVLSGRDRSALHRPELCIAGQGWKVQGRRAHRVSVFENAPPLPATLLTLEREVRTPAGGRGRIVSVCAYFFVGADAIAGTHGERLWKVAADAVLRGRSSRWAYVLAQADAHDGEAAALARLEEVLRLSAPAFLARGAPGIDL